MLDFFSDLPETLLGPSWPANTDLCVSGITLDAGDTEMSELVNPYSSGPLTS